ncbi:MAG: fibronectin type III domain-containing protein [Verrucomicrobiales bacterium]
MRGSTWVLYDVFKDLGKSFLVPLLALFVSVISEGLAGEATALVRGSRWQYLNGGPAPDGWAAPEFNADNWPAGKAPLGFGDGEERTFLDRGPSLANPAVYFRRTFNVPAAALVTGLALKLQRDDGAVVYLNGIEVARSNMPEGAIHYTTLAASRIDQAIGETSFTNFSLPVDTLRTGANVLAVEVHQSDSTSSDLRFDAELLVETAAERVRDHWHRGATSYFLMDNPARVLRFDAATNGWLTPIALTEDDVAAQQVAADGDGILIGPNFSEGLTRIREDGVRMELPGSYSGGVLDIVAGERTFWVSRTSRETTAAMSSGGEFLVQLPVTNFLSGVSLSYIPGSGNLIAGDDGALFRRSYGRIPLFVLPGNRLALAGTGDVFSTHNDTLVGDLRDALALAAFPFRDAIVTYNGGQLSTWNAKGELLGSAVAPVLPLAMTVRGNELLLFSPGTAGGSELTISRVSLAFIGLSNSADVNVSAAEMPFAISENAFAIGGNRIAMLSEEGGALLYWDASTGNFTSETSLDGAPTLAVHDAARNRAFIGNDTGGLSTVNLTAPAAGEAAFASVGSVRVHGVAFTSDAVFVGTDNAESPGQAYAVFNLEGTQSFSSALGDASTEHWKAIGQSMFYSRFSQIVAQRIDGYELGFATDSNSSGYFTTFRERADLQMLATSRGQIFELTNNEARPLAAVFTGPDYTSDSAWLGDRLVTIEVPRTFEQASADTSTVLTVWQANGSAPAAQVRLPEPAARVFVTQPGRQVVAAVNRPDRSLPVFYRFDGNLSPVSAPATHVVAGDVVPRLLNRDSRSITIEWDAVPGATGYRVETMSASVPGSNWTTSATTSADTRQASLSNLSPGTSYRARIVVLGGDAGAFVGLERWFSTSPSGAPAGIPYELTITSATASSIHVEWAHSGTNATGYELLISQSSRGESASVVAVVAANVRQYTFTALEPATRYYVAVRAVNTNNGTKADISPYGVVSTLADDLGSAPLADFFCFCD